VKSRVFYERIEPVAESFGDLDPDIDARINDVDSEADWTGFHVIERALWENNTTEGMKEFADKLDADVKKLDDQVKTLEMEPTQMVAGAMELLNEAATTKITGEEEAYSHTDLSDLAANVEGSKVVYQAIIPALNENDEELANQLDTQFNTMEEKLAVYQSGDSYVDYTKLSKEQIREISTELSTLAELMAKTGAIFN
jgi:iron uptake system component EfeO